MLRAALEAAGLNGLVDTAVLLASELCDNAVLHAGTEFDIELTVTPTEVTVAVTDQGAGPLELHLATPRTGRAATHGRGLLLVERLATVWGTRHDASGHHRIWFTLNLADAAEPPASGPVGSAEPSPASVAPHREWPTVRAARWLLHIPPSLATRLELSVLATELLRRLCDVLDAEGADVSVEYGDGRHRELAQHGQVAQRSAGDAPVLQVPLPLPAPLRGLLRLAPRAESAMAAELADLTTQRIALAIESDWLRGADQRRRSWMTYLAETSELLLAQSLDVELTVAVVPALVVPRLGRWCAVHMVDEAGSLRLAALTHADENAIPMLRAGLDTARSAELHGQLAAVIRRAAGPAGISVPANGIAVALTARGQPLGTLTVGRSADRPHTPEEIALISDLARRASLAIDNAQITATHAEASQALQQALLPRELPTAAGVEFAAQYLPASPGSEVGGDFYDVLTLDNGCWLTLLGDVCGKGVRAAARTGLVRDVLRVLVRDGRPLQRAIELLNGVMMEANNPEQFCTLATALISHQAGGDRVERPGLGVELVLAGHEQPVLLRADGSAELIGEHGTAVGLVHQVRPASTRHWLQPGDALVTYTDGVTERRRGQELFGQDRLLDALAARAGGSATELVAAVQSAVEAFSADPGQDDIAVLVVRAAPN